MKPISESVIVKFLTPCDFWVCVNSFLMFIMWPAMFSYCIGAFYAEFKFHNYNAVIENTRLENIVDYIQRDKNRQN